MNEIQSINEQIKNIANFARAYANATPEQRARISRQDVQHQLNRYNELKQKRDRLYTEQENRVMQEIANNQQQQPQINYYPLWRRITPKVTQAEVLPWAVTPTPTTPTVPEYTNLKWHWYDWLVKPMIWWVQNRFIPSNTKTNTPRYWYPIYNKPIESLDTYYVSNPQTYNQLLGSIDYSQWWS